jgi:GNAT superfamily N-acetyltransferase
VPSSIPAPVASALVRDAVPADLPAMREVLRAAYQQYAAAAPPEVFPVYLADVLDLDRHARLGQPLVAEVAGQVLAAATFYPDATAQGLAWPAGWASGRGLGVDPTGRGHGLARALLAECERRARTVGAPVFAFHTAGFMTRAVRLYDRLGYRRAPEFDVDMGAHYSVKSAERFLAIAYRRDLPAPAVRPDQPAALPTAA